MITYGNERSHRVFFVSWTSDIGKFGYVFLLADSNYSQCLVTMVKRLQTDFYDFLKLS